MSEKMRTEFEDWASQFFKMDVESWGEYVDSETHWAWLSWQASRSALVVELPGAIWCSLAYHEAINDVKEALDDAGVSYK